MTFRYLACQQALQLGDIANSTRASGKRGVTPLAALSLARAYRAGVARRLFVTDLSALFHRKQLKFWNTEFQSFLIDSYLPGNELSSSTTGGFIKPSFLKS